MSESQAVRQEESKQDYPLQAVPQSARRSDWTIALILLGFTFWVGSMYAGGQVGPGFSFWNMVGVVMLGSAMLGAYVCVLTAMHVIIDPVAGSRNSRTTLPRLRT